MCLCVFLQLKSLSIRIIKFFPLMKVGLKSGKKQQLGNTSIITTLFYICNSSYVYNNLIVKVGQNNSSQFIDEKMEFEEI